MPKRAWISPFCLSIKCIYILALYKHDLISLILFCTQSKTPQYIRRKIIFGIHISPVILYYQHVVNVFIRSVSVLFFVRIKVLVFCCCHCVTHQHSLIIFFISSNCVRAHISVSHIRTDVTFDSVKRYTYIRWVLMVLFSYDTIDDATRFAFQFNRLLRRQYIVAVLTADNYLFESNFQVFYWSIILIFFLIIKLLSN